MTDRYLIENATDSPVELEPLADALERACKIESIAQDVSVLLTTDDHIRDLNNRFRGIDARTDVLTFPSGLGEPFPLGDVAISLPYAEAQASLRGVALQQELIALIVHGVLHLVGYDDENEEEKKRMQLRMNEVGDLIGTPIDAFWTSVLHQNESDGE